MVAGAGCAQSRCQRWLVDDRDCVSQAGHVNDRVRSVSALVALAAARASKCLVHVLDREDSKCTWNARVELDILNPARSFAANKVVVTGLAADDRAKTGDAVVVPGFSQIQGSQWELERPGNFVLVDAVLADSGSVKRVARAGDQAQREVFIEVADHDCEAASFRYVA